MSVQFNEYSETKHIHVISIQIKKQLATLKTLLCLSQSPHSKDN